MTATTRRTVVRGAAWTAPLIAVGVAAPAFAASPKPPPTIVGTVVGGKCPGQSTEFDFGFVLPIYLSTAAVTFAVTNLTYNGENVTVCTKPTGDGIVFAVSWDSTSSANGTGSGTGVASGTYDDGVNPNAPFGPINFSFSYDGTKPVDNKNRQAICTAAALCG